MAAEVATFRPPEYRGRDVRRGLVGDDPETVVRKFHSVIRPTKTNWNSLWAKCTRYTFPEMEYFERDPINTSTGEQRTPRLYDNTATTACEQFPAVIEGILMPRNERWHGLRPPLWTGLQNDKPSMLWCEQATEVLFAVRYNTRSNFMNASSETAIALGMWGTGAFYIEDRDAFFPILYRPVPLWELYGIEGESGLFDEIWRYFVMTAHQLLGKSEWLADYPDEIFDMAEKNPMEKFYVLQHTYYVRGGPDAGRIKNCYYLDKSRTLVQEEFLHSWPWVTPRIMKMPGENYGRSPLMAVLPTVQALQEVRRSFIRQSELQAEPPLGVAEEDSIGPISLMPAAINFGAVSAEGRMLVQPIQATGQIQVTENMIDGDRLIIKEAFYLDFLQIIRENPDMTATAVMEITSQRGQMLAPKLGRLQNEMLEPMIERELAILMSRRLLPPMPPELARAGQVEPMYDNLLTRAQMANQAIGIVRVGQFAGETAQLGKPDVLDGYNADAAFQKFAQIQGVPVEVINSPDEIENIRAQRAQQEQMMTAVAAAEPVSKSIDNLASAAVKAQGVQA